MDKRLAWIQRHLGILPATPRSTAAPVDHVHIDGSDLTSFIEFMLYSYGRFGEFYGYVYGVDRSIQFHVVMFTFNSSYIRY